MAARFAALLPRFVILVCLFLLGTATFTFAAGKKIGSAPVTVPVAVAPPVLVVPDVRRQAYVFAKGILEDAGFAWKVEGPVRGYAANNVVLQQPLPGTRVVDTGAPLIVLRLASNSKYAQHGLPEDVSSYVGTEVRLADVAAVAKPAAPALKPAPAAKPAVAPKPAARPKPTSKRPRAFVVAGARPEPLDEMPLPDRARLLGAWVSTHPEPTNENVRHWLYQNAWIVTGAKFGWWHGAEALRTLVQVDRQARSKWGIGDRSESVARAALVEVEASSR
jgi:hypothetical protein